VVEDGRGEGEGEGRTSEGIEGEDERDTGVREEGGRDGSGKRKDGRGGGWGGSRVGMKMKGRGQPVRHPLSARQHDQKEREEERYIFFRAARRGVYLHRGPAHTSPFFTSSGSEKRRAWVFCSHGHHRKRETQHKSAAADY